MTNDRNHQKLRLKRQFDLLGRKIPFIAGVLRRLQDNGLALLRIPLGLVFIAGSFLAILPFLGLWMLPVGLLLLAVDVPAMRPAINAIVIRARRRITLWKRRLWPDRSD